MLLEMWSFQIRGRDAGPSTGTQRHPHEPYIYEGYVRLMWKTNSQSTTTQATRYWLLQAPSCSNNINILHLHKSRRSGCARASGSEDAM